jgi:endonuclease III
LIHIIEIVIKDNTKTENSGIIVISALRVSALLKESEIGFSSSKAKRVITIAITLSENVSSLLLFISQTEYTKYSEIQKKKGGTNMHASPRCAELSW